MRRTAFSIALAAEMFVLTGMAAAQPGTPSQPASPAQPAHPAIPDRTRDPVEREKMQKEWDTLKKEWESLTPEARLLSVVHAKNLEEIELGRMAQGKATAIGVKEYAAMMVKDHTEADSKLTRLGTTEKITLWDTARTNRALMLKKMFEKSKDADKDKDKGKNRKDDPAAKPGDADHDRAAHKDGKDPMDKLRDLSGEQFDAAYSHMMHMGHGDLLKFLEKESPQLTNANVKTFASDVTATVRRHRDQAAQLDGNKDKDKSKPRDPKAEHKDPVMKDPNWDR